MKTIYVSKVSLLSCMEKHTKHVLSFLVTEVLGNSKASKGDTGTSSRGLVHLTEDQRDLGFTVQLNDT